MQTSRDGFTAGLLPDLLADGREFISFGSAALEPWIAEFVAKQPNYWKRDLNREGWVGSVVDRPHWYYFRAAPPKPNAPTS